MTSNIRKNHEGDAECRLYDSPAVAMTLFPAVLGMGNTVWLLALHVAVPRPIGQQSGRIHASFDAGKPLAPLAGGAFAVHGLEEVLQVLQGQSG
jgi:hypothetical protein